MSINTTRLSQKIGKILGGLNETNAYRGTTLVSRRNTIYAQYASAGPEDVEGIFDAVQAADSAEAGIVGYYRSLLSQAIITEVQLDRVLASPTLDNALTEWVRQMRIAGDSFQDCPATLTVAAVGSPVGTVKWVLTADDGTGVTSDLVIPDVYLLTVTGDDERGGTKWAETYSIVGRAATADAANADYPTGSGVNTTAALVDPAVGDGKVTDPTFADWTGNTPDNWTISSGVAGTTVLKVADDPRDGANGFALRLFGDGATLHKIRQVVSVEANTVYVIYYRLKKAADPGADWGVTVRLVDTSTGTAVSGCSVASVTAASVAANWTDTTNNIYGTVVTTPTTMPVETALEIVFHQFGNVNTAAVAGADVYVDWVNIVSPLYLYDNGPAIVGFSGTTEAVLDDTWTLTANISGSPSGYMIRGIDRLLTLSNYDVRIPTASVPTQSNALIS